MATSNYTLEQSLCTDDFTGAAKIFLSDSDRLWLNKNTKEVGIEDQIIEDTINADYIDLNLLITDVNFSDSDIHQLDLPVGDTFGIYYYGRSPMILNVTGVILDDYKQVYKRRFTKLYQHLFRISAVSKFGVVPNLEFIHCVAQGAFMSLSISDNSQVQDHINVAFTFLVLNLFMFNNDNESGVVSASAIFNEGLQQSAVSNGIVSASTQTKKLKDYDILLSDVDAKRINQVSLADESVA